MIAFLRRNRNFCHESKRLDEIGSCDTAMNCLPLALEAP
jgi:hypothetical protein